MNEVMGQLVAGLAQGSTLFLVAIGLSLTLGVMNLLNFANGAFLIFGGYGIIMLFGNGSVSLGLFLLGVLGVAFVTGVIGGGMEIAAIRKLYSLPHLFPLLGTYALFLVVQGLAIYFFGVSTKPSAQVSIAYESFEFVGLSFSKYAALLVLAGIVILVAIWLMVNKTTLGLYVRATAQDREMARLLGVDVNRVFLAMFALSALLVGCAGGLMTVLLNVNPSYGGQYLIEAFVVVIVGGVGSIVGTYIAAIGLSVIVSLVIVFSPEYAMAVFYLAMVVAVVWRPEGLLRTRGSSAAL